MSTKVQARRQQAGNDALNVEKQVSDIRNQVDANLQGIFDKAVLSGLRVMFDKSSHQMALAELDKPGPMPQKLAAGILGVMYLIWKQSNQTLPPKIMVPVTMVLTLRAFQFLQLSKDPQATREVMGESVALATQGIMDKFGATQDKLPALLKGQPGAAAQPQQPQPQARGMLAGGQ